MQVASDDETRVLILSASIGGGHVAAGRALANGFVARGAMVEHVDLLEHTAAPFRRLYRQAYFDLVRTVPDLVEWLGRRLDRHPSELRTTQQQLRARLVRLLSYEVPRIIDRYRPDVLVHTHFLGAEIVSGRLKRHRALPQVEVITDFFAHSFWLQPGIARYFVATEEVRVHLLAAGVDAHRVRVTGIPIDPSFGALPDSAQARARLGIDPSRELLLVLAGGMDTDDLRTLLQQLRGFRWPLQVMVVCGRSTESAALARDLVAEAPGPTSFDVRGFVDDMATLMAAADLAVTKPGGLTSSEALAAGLPLMLIRPYPLQEEANANVLLEHGVAVRVEPLSTFGHKLRRLLEEPERRSAMRAATKSLARPNAADDIARAVLEETLGHPRQAGVR